MAVDFESVQIAGGPGTGKTTALAMIAAANPERPCFVLDNESKFRRIAVTVGLETHACKPEPCDKKSTHVYRTTDIKRMIAATKYITAFAEETPNCIVLMDMVEKVWERSQEFFAQAKYGEDFNEHLSQKIADSDKGIESGFEGFEGDWKAIKGWHNRVVEALLYEVPAHVFMSAGTRKLRKDTGFVDDSPPVRQVFEAVGEVPEGEKRNWFRFITIIVLRTSGLIKKYDWSLVKDESRELNVPIVLTLHEKLDTSDGMGDLWAAYAKHVGIEAVLEDVE